MGRKITAAVRLLFIARRVEAGDDHTLHKHEIVRCARAFGIQTGGVYSDMAELFSEAMDEAEKVLDQALEEAR